MPRPEISKTKVVFIKTMHVALQILREHGGQMHGGDVLNEIERRVSFDDWERGAYEKTGYVRWRSIFHFHSIAAIKTGLLIKKRGVWYLTPDGEQALAMTPEALADFITEGYKEWREANPKVESTPEDVEEDIPESSIEQKAELELTVETIEENALEGIKTYILSKNPYQFQDLCAALLRGMGYYTPFVAPKGKDGGIDIIAYRDPLGTVSPRIKVQVKHRPDSSIGNADVNQLRGVLGGDSEVGIFISSGGFSSDARNFARTSSRHIELIDLDRFIELWEKFYDKLNDEDKRLLPLNPVYVLSLDEQ
jgi:restriction system protein